ncbi:pentapeptide repeat-containing protein [Kribbella sp. NPDC056861]|uniref:pentapeptide repeat-containing protein n=1 Tax=Kribbella sp. NPDC056861 TaxID=3154857 RepID=UPI00342C0766
MPPRKAATKIATPRLRTQLEERALTADEVGDEDRLTDLELTDQNLGGLFAEHVELSGCRLTRVNLGGSELEKLILVDLELDHCDLANARWADASGTRLSITSSRLTGFAGPGLNLQHVTLRDTVLDFASFRFAKFVKVEFTDCRLQGADFVSADLSGTVFRRCDLTGVEFSQVSATGAVFVDCTWDGTRGIGSLAGATIANSSPIDTLAVTVAMATALGITLGDPDDHAAS